MYKIVTIIGARPQFIKAAAISRAIRTRFSDRIREIIVHTGQHYDADMSEVFFRQLHIPKEDYNLGVGSGSHGVQTAKMIIAIEDVLQQEQPDAMILYGDTNSTLAGAVAASKLSVPIVHIEAGMRSFTKRVPEEINRILCDHVSTLLFTPTLTGARNLYREGFASGHTGIPDVDHPKVIPCGDIMYDNSLHFRDVALRESRILDSCGVKPGAFTLVTVHRNNNTEDPNRLAGIFGCLAALARAGEAVFVIPIHPRTRAKLDAMPDLKAALGDARGLVMIPPASYLDMIALEAHAEMIITDSGGVQKEAYYFEKPCVILQDETPWEELVASGNAQLAGADPVRMEAAFRHFRAAAGKLTYPPLFGDGKAAEFTVGEMLQYLDQKSAAGAR